MNTPVIDPIASFLGQWSININIWSILFRILLSVGLAAIIGCERSSKRHSAGLRTFILVSLASTIAMMLDVFIGISETVEGLTTSVGLWTCGIIGLSAGAGYYTVAIISFFALLCSLSFFPAFEVYLKNRSNHFEVHLELISSTYLQNFVTTIRRLGLTIDDIESNPAYVNSGLSVYSVAITISSTELKKYKTHKEIIEALRTLDYVYHIEEMQR